MTAVMLRRFKDAVRDVVLFLDRPTGDEEQCVAFFFDLGRETIVHLPTIMKQTRSIPMWPSGVGIMDRLRYVGYTDLQVYARSTPALIVSRKKSPNTERGVDDVEKDRGLDFIEESPVDPE